MEIGEITVTTSYQSRPMARRAKWFFTTETLSSPFMPIFLSQRAGSACSANKYLNPSIKHIIPRLCPMRFRW